MTLEQYFVGVHWSMDASPTWVDWMQLGASYVGSAVLLLFVVWLFRQSMRHVANAGREHAAEIDEKTQYITGLVSALRLLLSTRRV
jgi:hypothetical protein